jgi:tetratricopeptide (TPR) repeat protein
MHASACESGTDTWRELQRRGEHRSLQSGAFFVVVGISEKESAIPAAVVDEFGRANLSVLHEVAFVKVSIDDQPDLISPLNFGAEVDLPLEHLCQLRNEIVALRLFGEGFPKRAPDVGVDRRFPSFQLELFDVDRVCVGLLLDLQNAFVVDLVFERFERAVELFLEAERVSRTQLANIENRLDATRHFIGKRDRNLIIDQRRDERRISLYSVFDHLTGGKRHGRRGKAWYRVGIRDGVAGHDDKGSNQDDGRHETDGKFMISHRREHYRSGPLAKEVKKGARRALKVFFSVECANHLMLGMGRHLLILSVLMALAIPSGWAQRRPRSSFPSTNLSGALGALGILPDSVQAILLLYSGKNLTRSKADEFEADVRKKPDNLESRLNLIGYYTWNGHTPADHLRLRTHVLWVVENRPEHPATAEPSLRDLPDDPEGNTQIRALWDHNLESRGQEVAVLKNAQKFFFGKDPAAADRIIHQLSEQEPNNPQWAAELAQLYRMFGIPDQHIADPAEQAMEAYRRVLALTRNSAARETLAGDMAAAAFRIGDYPGAAQLAKVHLQSPDRNAVQRANTLLGRVALVGDDIAGSKQYLLASSGSAAARGVSVSGPTMVLAKELLEKGEHDAVIQYLENCVILWPRGEPTLQNWIAEIKRGKTPNFGSLGF